MDTKDTKPGLTVVDNVKTLEQPLSTADAALAAYNMPDNIANVEAQAIIDAHSARVRYLAFIDQGFTPDQAITLVVEGVGVF